MNNHIFKSPNPLPRDECNLLIKAFEANATKAVDGPQNEYTIKNNKFFYKTLPLDVFNSNFGEHLAKNVRQYISEQRGLRTLAGFSVEKSANLIKYNPGERYSIEHCEHSPNHGSYRVLAWMYYLNTIPSELGGGTSFPQQNLVLQPEAGSLYVWPAGFTHTHQGLPCKTTKYIISGWCSFNARNDISSPQK